MLFRYEGLVIFCQICFPSQKSYTVGILNHVSPTLDVNFLRFNFASYIKNICRSSISVYFHLTYIEPVACTVCNFFSNLDLFLAN